MKAAAIQMTSGREVGRNLIDAERLISSAVQKQAKLVVLPENFSFLGADDGERLQAAERPEGGPAQAFLAEQAKRHGIWLVGGTIPIAAAEGRVRSRSLLFDPSGQCVGRYDKVHLFDVEIPDGEQESYRESATTEPGTEVVVTPTDLGRVGMTVCYDLRFPAMFNRLGLMGADIITVPAAFTVPTGRAHWQPLLQARAIESLGYVVAAAQWGEHAGGRKTYGHSMIVDPWGEILARLEAGAGVVIAELDMIRLERIRTAFPVLTHRREL